MTDFEQDVIERLTRIETNQTSDAALGKDHEERLRSMEGSQRVIKGALGLLVPVLAFLGYHVNLH